MRFPIDPHRLIDPAHLLSLSRVFLAGFIWLRPADVTFVAVVVAVAGLTDLLDGLIGRRLHAREHDDIGSWLDPVCDKVFAASAAVAVVVAWPVTPWLLPLLLVRDVLTLVLALAYRRLDPDAFRTHDFHARPLGKATTVLQTVTIACVLFFPAAAVPSAVAAAVVGAAAVADRVLIARRSRTAGITASAG